MKNGAERECKLNRMLSQWHIRSLVTDVITSHVDLSVCLRVSSGCVCSTRHVSVCLSDASAERTPLAAHVQRVRFKLALIVFKCLHVSVCLSDASAERTPLAAHGTACAVQAVADCFQVPPRPGTVLPHRRLRPCVIRGWSTSAAVR